MTLARIQPVRAKQVHSVNIAVSILPLLIFFGVANIVDAATISIEETTITQLQAAYLTGKATAREVTQAYLDRITAYDKHGPYLNALITVNSQALADAARLDAILMSTGKLSGPLHGIPVIVKDNIDTGDMPTTYGVALFKDFVPPKDAFIVRRLRAAGAIILATSSLSELAMGASATVLDVNDNGTNDRIAQRLRDLGFVAGEPVRLVARGPLGADPLLVQIGYTRFALRRAEAARVTVAPEAAP